MIEEIILFGAISGAVYALLAVGFTLIFGVSGVVNLAHGSFFMLGAYMFSAFGPEGVLRLESVTALILAAIFVGIIGAIVYRLTMHPIIENQVGLLVVTVCVAIIFQQIMYLAFGPIFHSVNWPRGSFLRTSISIWGVTMMYSRLLTFGASLALFASLWIFIRKTKIGEAMRAVSQDREMAMLVGINTERLYVLTMALSASLAALAGIFIASSTTGVATAWMWMHPLAMSFAIVILGGLGSIKGTIIGAFIVGYARTTVAVLVPEGGTIVPIVPLTIMVLILVLRPKGLFGKHIEME